MNCEWLVRLDGYVDGELSPEKRAQYEQHLRDCPSCASTALSRLQMKRGIRAAAAGRYRPSAELRFRVARMTSPRPRASFPWLPQFSLAVAALVLVMVAAALWLARSRPADFASELLDLHVSTLASANPVDVLSSDRHTVKPWFEGRLPFAFILPNLQEAPFRLIGGRLTYVQQAPGAQLLFGLGKHQISVFIFQQSVRQLRSSTETRELGFTIDTWTQDGLRYAAVGDTEPAQIRALRQLFQAAHSNKP
jgi:anti-sigma factor RsiW